MPVPQRHTADRKDAAHGRGTRLPIAIATLLVAGFWLATAPPASAARGSVLRPPTLSRALTRTGRDLRRTARGSGSAPAGTMRAIPLLSPPSARLDRIRGEAATRLPGSGGPLSRAPSRLPRAVLFGGLDRPGMSAAESAGEFTPPDTTGAIGPGNYLEVVNGTGIAAYDRSLNAVSGPVSLGEFIGAPLDEVFDPQIQWDQSWGRWIYAMDDIERFEFEGEVEEVNYLDFGWSKSADPTDLSTESEGGWCGYFLPTEEEFDDYPKLGHGDAGITIGTNAFGTEFLGSRLWSIAKPASPRTCPELSELSIGVTGSALETEDGALAFTPVPANTADSSARSYVVAADFPGEAPAHQIMAWHISGAGAGATLFEDGEIEVATYDFPASVPQPGSPELIDSSDARLTNAVAVTDPEAGKEAVWTQHTVAGPEGRSVVRWYELLPGVRALRQQGTISDPEQFVFNAAISPAQQGDSAMIDYNRGSATLYPDMHAQSRDRGTPLGRMEGDVTLGTSEGPDADESCNVAKEEPEPCRWGDYAGASPDPSQPGVVWGSSQGLAEPNGESATWTTRNFALRTDVRPPAAPTISGTKPASPANDNRPKVKGSAESRSTVRVYKSAGCSGPVAAEGAAAAFASPGLAIAVGDNKTVPLTATATDAAGNSSACSSAVSYTERTPGTLFARRVAPVRGGRALLRVLCRGGPCRGSLRLIARVKVLKGSRRRVRNLAIGRTRYSVAAGRRRVLRVPLTRKGKAVVRKAGRHGLTARLRGARVHRRGVELRLGKRGRRR
jgi:hypothetical protein